MVRSKFQTLTIRVLSNKLLFGGLAAAITAIISMGGMSVASAATSNSSSFPPNEVACSLHFKDYHFKSVQQCQNWWNQQHGGSGYGGNGGHGNGHHHFRFHFHFHFHPHFGSFGRYFHRFHF